jgi:hypothetical protein
VQSFRGHLHISISVPISRILTEAKSLSRLAIDTTIAPDGATTLRESIKPHPTTRPRYATPPRLNAVGEEDANYLALGTLQLVSTPKTMPTWGRATSYIAIVRSGRPRYRVSPRVSRTRIQEPINTK